MRNLSLLATLLLLALVMAACAAPAALTPTSAPAAATKAPAATSPTAAATAAAKATTAVTAAATAAAKPTTSAQAATTPSAGGKTTTVRFGSPGLVSDAGVFVAIEKGYFRDLGLEVQIQPFQSGPLMIPPLAAGDLEVGGGVISPGLLNANERGITMKMVATKGSSRQGFEFSRVTIRKDLLDSGKVKEVKDVKGMKVAVPSLKSGAEAQVQYFMEQAGLTNKDVEMIALAFPDMIAAYSNKAIDLAVQTEPTLNTSVDQGLAVRWAPGAMSVFYKTGDYQASTLVFSDAFMKNGDLARKFMVGYIKGVRDYNDAFVKNKNKDEIITMLTKYSEKNRDLYGKMEMPYLDPDGKINVPSMQKDFDYFKLREYYTGSIQLQTLIDAQYIDYAVQQLGAYK